MAEKDDKEEKEPQFTIPMPGGKVARVPVSVLEQYVDDSATACHADDPPDPAPGEPDSGTSMITINIYAGSGQVAVHEHDAAFEDGSSDNDVTAHSMSVDAATGMSDWHTDWEYGECEYTDESGFPQRIQAWHRHPFGTEYTELYEG